MQSIAGNLLVATLLVSLTFMDSYLLNHISPLALHALHFGLMLLWILWLSISEFATLRLVFNKFKLLKK